jgi:predicted kinase
MDAYLMIGAPGSGKSTYAEKLAKTELAVIISGDDIRADLYGSADIQGNWGEIWERIDELVAEAAALGRPVILDGTHYRASYRKEALALLRSYGYDKVEALVVNPRIEVCLERNAYRSRKVPAYVIENMHAKLQSSLRNILDEDFTRVTFA